MFSTVRGKECGSTTKSKKDIGVSAMETRGKNSLRQENEFYLSIRPTLPSVSQRKDTGTRCGSINRYNPSGG